MQGRSMSGWRLTPKRIAMGDLTRELHEKRIAAEARKAELEAELAELEAGPLAEIKAVKDTVALFEMDAIPGSDYTKPIREALAGLNQGDGAPATQEETAPEPTVKRPVGRPSGSRGLPAAPPAWKIAA